MQYEIESIEEKNVSNGELPGTKTLDFLARLLFVPQTQKNWWFQKFTVQFFATHTKMFWTEIIRGKIFLLKKYLITICSIRVNSFVLLFCLSYIFHLICLEIHRSQFSQFRFSHQRGGKNEKMMFYHIISFRWFCSYIFHNVQEEENIIIFS